jgi:hypothetical protein
MGVTVSGERAVGATKLVLTGEGTDTSLHHSVTTLAAEAWESFAHDTVGRPRTSRLGAVVVACPPR